MTIWGDYSRIEGKKVFMGVAQIMLDDLGLSNIVIGWYKLFGTSSLVSYKSINFVRLMEVHWVEYNENRSSPGMV